MTENGTFTIADLRARLVVIDTRIAKARQQLARAAAEVEALEQQKAGAEAFITLLVEPEQPARGRATSNGITALVEGIMAEHPEGIRLDQIQNVAHANGHDLDGEQIRSAVTYLRRKGDAENIERGVWRLRRAFAQANGPAEAEPSSVVSSLPLATEVKTG